LGAQRRESEVNIQIGVHGLKMSKQQKGKLEAIVIWRDSVTAGDDVFW